MHKNLIVGISGQDGAYLARHLLEEGEQVFGTSRSETPSCLPNLVTLGVADRLQVFQASPSDGDALRRIVEENAIERIYLLAGQSSVGLSFAQPVATYRGFADAALAILELIRNHAPHVRLLYAGSGEVFAPEDGMPFTEHTRHRPKSPYAVAKSATMSLIDMYRAVYGVFAATAILFNHESPLRPVSFVLPKIVASARRMADGSAERLPLGNIEIARDWGWAPDYVVAMRKILDHDQPENFIVATGESHSIREAIDRIGNHFGFDLLARCDLSPDLLRPCEAKIVTASPAKIAESLGWRASTRFADIIAALCRGSEPAMSPRP